MPGISILLAFKGVTDCFHLFNRKNKDLVRLFRSNLLGGVSLIFDRFQQAGVTEVGHKVGGPITKKILGLGMFLFLFLGHTISGL